MSRSNAALGRRPRALLVDLDDTIIADSDMAEANWRAALDAASSVVAFPKIDVLEAIHFERDWFWRDSERHRIGRADLMAARRAIGDDLECDVAAPIRLGIRGVWIFRGDIAEGGPSVHVPDAIVPDLPALAALLAGLASN